MTLWTSYMGQTKRALKQLISEHKSKAIRAGNTECAIAKHYNDSKYDSPATLRFTNFEHVTLPARGGNLSKSLSQRSVGAQRST